MLRNISIERASEKNFDAVKRLTEHFSAREQILNDFYDAVRSRKRSVNTVILQRIYNIILFLGYWCIS